MVIYSLPAALIHHGGRGGGGSGAGGDGGGGSGYFEHKETGVIGSVAKTTGLFSRDLAFES